MTTWIGISAAVMLSAVAGVSFVIQQAVNADLLAGLGSAAWAGFVSYLGGTVCMLVLAVVLREAVPTMADIHRSHWWAWTGGFFGAVYIAISIFLVPRLGAAFFIALLVTGADGGVCRVRSFRLRLAYRSTRSTFLGSSGRYCS